MVTASILTITPNASAACRRVEHWPQGDRVAWEAGLVPGDPFDDRPQGPQLRAASLQKARKGYGRWLHFLDGRGWLDPALPPLARVTVPRLRAYFRALRRSGNRDWTVIGRFGELVMALRVMVPGADVSWVRKPDGATVYALLRRARRPMLVPDGGVLFAWGLEMMREAHRRPREVERLAGYRDGLLIAMLAACGRRLRSMALLRVGRELVRRDGVYCIELTAEQVKTNRADRVALPAELTPYVDRYLDEVRPTLLGGGTGDELWLAQHGGPQGEQGIQTRILRLTRRRFGVAFGPHRFRHAIVTTAALRLPQYPGLGAGVLNISPGVSEGHYDRSGQLLAGTRYAELIERRKRQSGRAVR